MAEQWHLSRSVSLTHVISTISLIVAAVFYVARTDNRVAAVEQDQIYLKDTISRVEEQQRTQGRELTNQIMMMRTESNNNFERLDKKLDKIIERELNNR